MTNINWIIHPVADTEPDGGTMYAVLPDDGTNGLLIGELHDVENVVTALRDFLETGEQGGEIPDVHSQLGARWLTVREASEDWGVPRATVTWAIRRGKIRHAKKLGNRWQFPQRSFLAWLANR